MAAILSFEGAVVSNSIKRIFEVLKLILHNQRHKYTLLLQIIDSLSQFQHITS